MFHIPLNAIHYYLALPFFLYLAPYGISQGIKTSNKINLYLGLSGFVFIFALIAYGGPALFTTNSTTLTWGTIIGDFFQAITLFINWLLVARIYFATSGAARLTVKLTGFSFAVAAIVTSYFTNLSQPTTLIVVGENWMLQYGTSFAYKLTTSLLFVSIILSSIKFILEANKLKSSLQRWKMRTFSAVFLIIGLLFVVAPLVSTDLTDPTNGLILTVAFAGLAVLALSTWLIKKYVPINDVKQS